MASVIAYLTSQYARATDTFIRAEVAELRKLGFSVHTFSVRSPANEEVLEPKTRLERQATEDLLRASPLRLFGSVSAIALTRPAALLRGIRLALGIGSPGFRQRLLPFVYLVEAAHLARRMENKGVQHLHNHIGRNSAAVAMMASSLSGIPYSLTIHGPTEFDMPGLLALDEKIARSSFTVAVSHFGASQLMRWSRPSDWKKIHVVRCGLGSDYLSAVPTPVPDVPVVTTVGRLVEQKGHLVLLEAVRQLLDEDVEIRVELIGSGPMKPRIESAIRELGLEETVHLAGWKDPVEVRRALRESRGMVLPSFAEGLPVALMEAMALGRPVVSTSVAGIPELVESGVSGWLIPPGAVEDLAKALRRLLSLPVTTLTEMGLAGRMRALKQHDAEREAKALASLITSTV